MSASCLVLWALMLCLLLSMSVALVTIAPLRSLRGLQGTRLFGKRATPSRDFQVGGRRGTVKPPPINQFIRGVGTVRVIGSSNESEEDDGEGSSSGNSEAMLGVFPIDEAQRMADEQGLDLVMINDKGDPPVCKIIDYGKYKYILEKKKKENAKKQARAEIKEVKMSYKIDEHDFQVRMRNVVRFLADGDRVKVVVQFKGREMQHRDLGKELLAKIYTPIEDSAVMESNPRIEGRSITMLVGPKKTQ